MGARTHGTLDVVLVDAVIDDVPLVLAWNLKDGVVGSAVDFVFWHLLKDDRLLCHFDWSEWRFRGSVANVVVRTASVIYRPKEIVCSLAIEHVWSLTIGVSLERTALWCEHDGSAWLEARHVGIQFCPCHIAVAPIDVVLARLRVCEYIHIDLLSSTHSFRKVADDRFAEIHKWTHRIVGNSNADFLASACIGTEIEVVFVRTILLLHFLNGWCPSIASCPCHLVALHVEHGAFVLPVDEVGGGEYVELISTPARIAIGG